MRSRTPLILISWTLSAGCFRSTEPIPAPGEGLFLSGTVVVRDLTTAETVPAAGAAVRVLGTSASATTDARGFFLIQRLPIGRYRVSIERRAPLPALGRLLDPVDGLVDGQSIDLGTIELLGTGSAQGFVGRDVGTGRPAAGAGALAVAVGTAFKAVAGEDGMYLLAGLPEGQIDVAAFLSGHAPGRISGVRISAGKKETLTDLLLEPSAGQLSATARGRAIASGADSSAGILVDAIDETIATSAGTASTVTDGSYELTLPVGVYRFRFSKEGYSPAELAGVGVLPEGVLGLQPVLLLPALPSDLDGDGIPDDRDPDLDNDGCPNEVDQFPRDPFSCTDTDGDTLPDELDPDDDADTLPDAEELAPGLDGWVTDPLDPDSDDDGVRDDTDNCPTVPNPGQKATDCPPGQTSTPRPRLDSISPLEGAPGEVVILRGAELPVMGVAVRFGPEGSGGYVRDFLVRSATEIHVAVPAAAESGRVTVYGPQSSVTSSQSFTVIHPPEIVEVLPRRARHGAVVTVVGRGFRPTGLMAGLVGSSLVVPQSTGSATVDGELLDLLRFVVPPDAVSAAVVVRAEGRTGTSAFSLLLSGDTRVDELRPNPAPIGATLTILGDGFSTADTGGAVMVRFSGAAGDVAPLEVHDASLTVLIPAGTISGPVTVVHPSATVSGPVPLTIDAQLPYLTGMSTTVAEEGQEVTLTGGNLANPTGVFFDGQAAAAMSATSNSVRATVPVAARPGFITVTYASAPMLQSPARLRILRMTHEVPTTLSRAVVLGSDGLVYGLQRTSGPTVQAFNATNLSLVGTELPVPLPVGDNNVQSARGNPGGTRVVIQTGLRSYVLDVPSFALRGGCDLVSNSLAPPAFDSLTRYAYRPRPSGLPLAELGLLRIDLGDGSCDYLARRPGANGVSDSAALSISPTEILVSNSRDGVGLFYSLRGDSLDGTVIAPPVAPIFGSNDDLLIFGPGQRFLYAGPYSALTGFSRATLGSAPRPLGPLAQNGLQSSDLRWLVANNQIWDLEAGGVRVVSRAQNLGDTGHAVMAGNVLWVPEGANLRRWEIFE